MRNNKNNEFHVSTASGLCACTCWVGLDWIGLDDEQFLFFVVAGVLAYGFRHGTLCVWLKHFNLRMCLCSYC